MTKREVIDNFRQKLREQNADSTYSNSMLYHSLEEQANWLIRREISRVYKNEEMFQLLGNFEVDEYPSVGTCTPIKTNCKVYRTKYKIPDAWSDDKGPILKMVSSIDNSTIFIQSTLKDVENKLNDPYQKMLNEKYYYYLDGYLYLTANPALINIHGMFKNDLALFDRKCSNCGTKECVKFLDTIFFVPNWLHAEMYAKAVQLVAGVSKRLVSDEQIDKNENRKN